MAHHHRRAVGQDHSWRTAGVSRPVRPDRAERRLGDEARRTDVSPAGSHRPFANYAGTHSRPKVSATAWFVTLEAFTLTPASSAAFSRTAFSGPLFASCTA